MRILSSFLLFAFGLLAGSSITAWIAPEDIAMRVVADSGSILPIVRIDGIQNGALQGSVVGRVRLLAGDDVVIPDASGVFAITEKSILTNVLKINVPAGMQFIASKRGKKYYPITSSAGQNLSPANRIYFATAEEAEKAGYHR